MQEFDSNELLRGGKSVHNYFSVAVQTNFLYIYL